MNVIMVSPEGGVDIEEVAEKTPEKIITIPIDPVLGLQPFQGRKIAYVSLSACSDSLLSSASVRVDAGSVRGPARASAPRGCVLKR